ncbi:ATP-binding protein [Gemmiger sp.]
MSDEETRTKQPLSMTRRYRRGLILTGLLCVLAMLAAATVLFQRSYAERIDTYLTEICEGYAAAYKAQDTHDAEVFVKLLPTGGVSAPRFTLIDTDGTVLFDSKTSALVYDGTNTLYAVMDSHLPNHADRPEFQQAMENGSAGLTRESETLQQETHYYAVRIDLPEGAQVLRVGEDVANIWGLSTDTLPLLCGAVVLILLAATLFSWWLTRRMVQPINHLAEHLDTIEADVPYEELIPLARTIQTDRKLREDNETMRREFTANVSHELKTPLTSISGYAELIETGMAKPADVPTFAARIHKEAQRMISLVSDILQLSELDSTQASHSRETVAEMGPVDLAALVKETAQNMTVNARRAYVTLQYDAKPATVRGSRDQLSELAQNLCDNAIRYNRPGGHVELRCGVGGDGCPYFEVEDNGIGIPQDSQTRVFERFYRVDKSRSKATGGTGLGLAIVKHIALLHDAKIDLQSQVGTGTTIRVTFPKNS